MKSVTSRRCWFTVVLPAILIAAMVPTISFARPAAAATAVTWHEGAVITKPLLCEDGTAISAHARVDWSYDPYTHSPIVGERYQIQIEVWADDSPCGTPDVVVSFQPPPNTATAVDTTAPVECYSGTEIAPGCTGLKPSENPNYPFIFIRHGIDLLWSLSTGQHLRFVVPVVTSAPIDSGVLTAVAEFRPPTGITENLTATNEVTVQTTRFTGGFQPVTPVRVLDTRSGPPVPPGGVVPIAMTGHYGIPADATAVVLNVTATDPAGPGYLTVYPCGMPPPQASNVNYGLGESVPNLVVVQIGVGGSVCITTFAESHIVADLSAYHVTYGDVGFVPIVPSRLRDTRQTARVKPGAVLSIKVAGVALPTDAIGGVFNITVTDPEGPGFVTAYPCDAPRPLASNLNYVAGQSVANLVMLGLGNTGSICLFTMAATQLIVDTTGYFLTNSGAGLTSIPPARILDTRLGAHFKANETRTIPLTGLPANAVGVVVNLTATASKAPGYLTVFPCGQGIPSVSNVNYIANDTVPNLVAVGVGLGAGGQKSICIFSLADTDVLVDIAGYYGSGNYIPVQVDPGTPG